MIRYKGWSQQNIQYLRLVSNTCCYFRCNTFTYSARLFMRRRLPAGIRAAVFVHTGQTVDTYWPAFTYSWGGVEGAGGGMETYCCADSRWFPRETAGSDGISYGSRSRRICAVGSQTLPCQGASPCTDTLVPLLWLTCSAARKVVFILIIMRCNQGKVAEARVHRRCMKAVEPLSFTHTWVVEHGIQNTRAAAHSQDSGERLTCKGVWDTSISRLCK